MIAYEYEKSVNPSKLWQEVSLFLDGKGSTLQSVTRNTDASVLTLELSAALSTEDKTDLDTVVASHNPITWELIKEIRASLFAATEWIKLRHKDQQDAGTQTTLTPGEYEEWLDYWQELRDLPETYANPEDVVFPQQPSN